jgi:hypothetical protein
MEEATMAERSLRGTRLGATSYETDEGVEPAARLDVAYDCPRGHSFMMPFSVEADVPARWECRQCGAIAIARDVPLPDEKAVKPSRTHWDMLLERRSIPELEELLEERLELLRASGGPARPARKSA